MQNLPVSLATDFYLAWSLTFRQGPGLFSNIKGLTYYKDNAEDPYITLKDVRYLTPVPDASYSQVSSRKMMTREKSSKSTQQTTS